jgi:hypothetical protein
LRDASAYVFSRRAYVWDGLDSSRVQIIAPCIDPFATKNQDLTDDSTEAILQAGGIVQGENGQAIFVRHDGTRARVTRTADVGGVTPTPRRADRDPECQWDRQRIQSRMDGFVPHGATDRRVSGARRTRLPSVGGPSAA